MKATNCRFQNALMSIRRKVIFAIEYMVNDK